MIEPEIAFADLEDNMELAEAMVKYIINYVLEHAPEEMEFFNKFMEKGLLERLDNIVNSDFGRVTYTEAVELLKKSGKRIPVSGRVGYRPADGARTLSDRRDFQETTLCHGLSKRDQSFLHEAQRRQQDRGSLRPAGTGRWRDHRRKPERRDWMF